MTTAAVVFLAFLFMTGAADAQDDPTPETLKQVLTERLQQLRPEGYSERQVLFQDVRAGTPNSGIHPFRVTATVRDYGPGYPANGYYGMTCVGQMDGWPFELMKDQFGDWQVQGRMTVTDNTCIENPAEGESSVPLETLAGEAAPPPSPAADDDARADAEAGEIQTGSYECWYFSTPQPGLNFTIEAPDRYTDVDGVAGSIVSEGPAGEIRFVGGSLDGQPALFERRPRPTVSFRDENGDEIAFCEIS